jgi:hypothetical protein
MSKLIIFSAVLFVAGVVFLNQRASLTKVRTVNAQLASQASVLHAHAADLDRRRADLQRQLAENQNGVRRLRQEQTEALLPKPEPEAIIVPPDSTRQGGWPAKAQYFYFPKKDLAAVSYRLFETNRLTDDAAVLFGTTPAEREAVDAAYDELWRKFRDLEIERMERVDKPKILYHFRDDESISYRIPSLEEDAGALEANFKLSLEQIQGMTRAHYLMEAVNDFTAHKLDDLGQHSRIISFGWVHQPSGEVQLGYAVLDEAAGTSTMQVINSPIEKDSQPAYYAQLFGIDVPIKDQ